MTRINTNVAALRGLQSVQKANNTLGTSLQRLSTGLQINNGKDNPSGLIASETLRSQVTAIEQSIKNSNRANNVIATADSALGEINGLLNQVRGLVQEGLNTGALSDSEVSANQLQIDAALNAINRIAGNTSFAGDKLIDGSKAFTKAVTTADQAKLTDIQLNEALFGSSSSITVDATITTAAAKGTLYYTGGGLTQATTVEVSGSKGSQVLFFGASSSEADITNAINNTSDVTGVTAASVAGTNATASIAGPTTTADLSFAAASAGTAGNNTSVAFAAGTTNTTTVSVSTAGAVTVSLAVNTGAAATGSSTGASTNATDDLSFTAASVGTAGNNTSIAFAAAAGSTASVSVSGSAITVNLAVETQATAATASVAGPTTQTYDDLSFTAVTAGTAGNNIAIVFNAATDATSTISVSGNTITVGLGVDTNGDVSATASDAATLISGNTDATALVSVTAGGSGTGLVQTAASQSLSGGQSSGAITTTASQAAALISANTNASALVTVGGAGTSATTTFATAAAANLSGGQSSGAITATASQAAAAIAANTSAAALVTVSAGSAGTGTLATAAATSLSGGADSRITLTSANFGSSEFVDINVLAGAFGTSTTVGGTTAYRDSGSDIAAIINGQVAVGKGLEASIASSSLNAALTFAEASNVAATNAKVTITGGGSVFQIGQDVSANGQVGIGIDAVNTARLGGVTGKLYELGSGAGKSLLDVGSNVQGADLVKIIEESIDRVSTLRGRLGALQKNVIETNISSLGVALENISEARSQIVDTDFAAETANLQKAQILNQSSLTVLGIANQQPGQVLSLLRG